LAGIQTALSQNSSYQPTNYDMMSLTTLSLASKGITSIAGLQYCSNLTQLNLNSNSITDMGPVTGLAKLSVLELSSNQISNVPSLSGMTSLGIFYLSSNPINGNLSFMSNMPSSLQALVLESDNITSMPGTTGNLTQLDLSYNQLTSMNGGNLLQTLGLSNNPITSLSGLTGGGWTLTTLDVSYTDITDLSPVVTLAQSGYSNLSSLIVTGDPLSTTATSSQIPLIVATGVSVTQ
jgi:Leucine-rich repeat (LRR) protein